MEIRTLNIGSGTADCVILPGGGRSLVILPGIGLQSITRSAGAIASAYRCFEKEYTLYILDRKNELSPGCTVEGFADDAAAAMDALKIESADVFGASLGGMIAQKLAVRHPERVRSLILGSTVSRPNPTVLKVIGEWTRLAGDSDISALCGSFLDKLYSPPLASQLRQASALIFGEITPSDLRRFILQARSIERFDCFDELDLIKCPALVIGVENDAVVTSRASVEIAEKLGCGLYIYGSEYGHCVFDEAPDYKQRMLDFLSGV